MADRYMHYGVEVIRQYVGSFRAELKKQGLAYVDLAIAPDIDVVVYNTIKVKDMHLSVHRAVLMTIRN